MKVIGFSAGSVGRDGNIDRMVKAILDKSGHDVEFVKLTDLSFSGCKGCVQLCARPQICTLADDAQPYYEKECEIGGVYKMLGDGAKELTITKEMFTRWENDSATTAAIDDAAEKWNLKPYLN